ncbi:leucine-rich repeat-containing protein 75A isoform 3-T3 [Dama dama]
MALGAGGLWERTAYILPHLPRHPGLAGPGHGVNLAGRRPVPLRQLQEPGGPHHTRPHHQPGPLHPLPQAGGRCTGRHGEAVPAADVPPQPPLPVEAPPRAGEEEAPGLGTGMLSPLSVQKPHSSQGLPVNHKCSLKAVLAGSPPDNTVDLSGIPLTSRDLERVTSYLQRCGEQVDSVELGFTGLTDDMVLQLLPALSTLPRLTTLALNGNRLTRALLRDLTDALRDPRKFPSVTWIDLGNNVDIFSLPQPFLLSLRKRSPKQGHLPTILELGEGPGSGHETQDEALGPEDPGGGPETPTRDQEGRETVGATQT